MDPEKKKTALRMIPYGLYILTSESKDGRVAAACVNWVTQASFNPPLVVVGVKTDSLAHSVIKETGVFALNVLGKNQAGTAFTFFKPLEEKNLKMVKPDQPFLKVCLLMWNVNSLIPLKKEIILSLLVKL